MADLSDVEAALAAVVVNIVYPGGTAVPSATGKDVKIFRGWPAPIGLNADLAAEISNISIFSDTKSFRETTRYPQIWREVSTTAPTMTTLVQGSSITLGGFGAAGQVVGVRIDDALYSVAVSASDTPTTVAAALCAMIPGAVVSGSRLTVAGGALVTSRVVGSGVSSVETRRQEQGFMISLWCADPVTRDGLAALIDGSLSLIDWLNLPDGSAGQLLYHGSTVVDTAENANLYRRDLFYTVEYPTLVFRTSSAMLFGCGDLTAGLAAPTQSLVTPEINVPLLGAIRFDAWYDPSDVIDQQCAAALSSGGWTDRLPPNAVVTNGEVAWPLANQQTLDAEITAAVGAGLSFWAFDAYQPNDGLSRALSLYLSSSLREKLQFCMLGQSSNWADPQMPDGYSAVVQRDVAMMAESGYLKVLNGRPVYFVLDASPEQLASLPPGGIAGAVANVRQKATAQGMGNPYIVWLSGAALEDYDNVAVAQALGADAAGAYACPRLTGQTQPYAALVNAAEQDWQNRAAAGFSMVATAMTGWDQRPMIEAPQSFYPLPNGSSGQNYYQSGDPTDIASHVLRLRSFTSLNSTACRAGLGLIYAWNELVEGGWIMPTQGIDGSNTSRTDALKLCLASWQSPVQTPGMIIA